MGPLDLVIHLLSFAAPGIAVALLVAAAARYLIPGRCPGLSWWGQFAINSIAGLVVLTAGLWHFGVDGKMATYAAMLLAVASAQWLSSKSWRA